MNIFFRVDSSIEIGTGHVMRSLTLAEDLRMKGANVFFICRKLQCNLINYIEEKGFLVYPLPFHPQKILKIDKTIKHSHWLNVNWETDVAQTINIIGKHQKIDWLIVDHYAINEKWEQKMRPFVKRIMIIDDLADRSHDCDLLLDQNLYMNIEARYEGLVPKSCLKLLGPRYALLRPEFKEARTCVKARDGSIRRILIFFGGSDPTNETMKVLEAIKLLNKTDIVVDVVVGRTNPQRNQVKQFVNTLKNVTYFCQIDYMADLMAKADLGIGAGGSTTWERCYLGLPTLVNYDCRESS